MEYFKPIGSVSPASFTLSFDSDKRYTSFFRIVSESFGESLETPKGVGGGGKFGKPYLRPKAE